jgi:predicted nuclease with TOPRIM domain
MMKRIFSSRRRLDVEADEDYDIEVTSEDGGLEEKKRPDTTNTASLLQHGESESFNNDAGFLERLEVLDPNWDEWSVGKDGLSGRNRMDPQNSKDRMASTKSASASGAEDLYTSKPRPRKKKSFVALSEKLRKLEETGFSGVPNDSTSLAAMTTGGMFVGTNADPKSRLNALMLERSNSDSNLHGKKKKKDKQRSDKSSSPSKPKSSTLSKRIRKSSRRSGSDLLSQTSHDRTHRSKSSSRRGKMKKNKSLSHIAVLDSSFSGDDDDKSKKKKKKKKKDKPLTGFIEDQSRESEDVRSKDGSKKKGKKKRSKSDFVDDASTSIASRTSTLASGEGSSQLSPISLSPKTKSRKKKEKEKEKESKARQAKSTSGVLMHPPSDDINSVPSLRKRQSLQPHKRGSSINRKPATEPSQGGIIRRHSLADLELFATNTSLKDVGLDVLPCDGSTTKISNIDFFEKAWSTDQAAATEEASQATVQAVDVQNTLNAAIAGSQSIGESVEGDQREKILRLQNQLAEALDKMVAISREQIQDKDQFLKASAELAQAKAELKRAAEEHSHLVKEVEDRDAVIEEERERIDKLEQAIERQLDTQDALEVKLERSEDEVEKLLVEMQELEAKIGSSEASEGWGASFAELHQTRKALIEKEDELSLKNEQIKKLEQELKDSLTVPQLQIEELDAEKKALQWRLKAERLEYLKQLEEKDRAMAELQEQVNSYIGTSDAPDLVSARQKLNEAREDATAVREDLEAAKKMIEQLQEEREDLLKRNGYLKSTVMSLEKNVQDLTDRSDTLNEKVKQWTERTYEWKAKAENAERKLDAFEDSDNGGSDASGDIVSEAPQGLFLQAAMEKNSDKKKGNKWNIFLQKGPEDGDAAVDDIRIRTLEERNQTLEDVVSELRSEIVKMQAAHKDELYGTKKRIAQLEGENEVLALQNATLEQLSRANH